LTHHISAVNRAILDFFAAIDRPRKCLQSDRKSFV